jgi:hypothetical protein
MPRHHRVRHIQRLTGSGEASLFHHLGEYAHRLQAIHIYYS